MRNKITKTLSVILSITLLATVGLLPAGVTASAESETQPIKILAIGNSYSNNSTELVSKIAESMGLEVTAASLYQAGCPLKRHVEYYEAYETLGKDGYYASTNTSKYEALFINGAQQTGNASIQEAIAYTDWDYITIQQMPDFCDDITSYYTEEKPYVTKLYNYVLDELEKNSNTKCEILFHQGWSFSHAMSIDNAYNYYPVDYDNTRDFFKAIEATVIEATEILKDKCGLEAAPDIVPSGETVQLAKDEFGFADSWGEETSLYADNISHLSYVGRYLIGCLWIEKFAEKAGNPADVRTSTYVPTDKGVTEEMAVLLRSCAHEVITGEADTVYGDWRAIPDGDGLKITHYVGEVPATGTVTIPALLDERSVTTVGETTFKYVEGVTGVVTVSNSVKIEEGALDGIKVLPTFWDGSSVQPSTGSGDSEADPMLITNAAELYWAVKNDQGKYFKLANDIYINDIAVDVAAGTVVGAEKAKNWLSETQSSAAFKGTIDGDGHTVYGLYIKQTFTHTNKETDSWNQGAGLIAKASGNVDVKNLGIENAYVDVTNAAASAFVGTTQNSASNSPYFENCYIGADVYLKGPCVGGFIGGGLATGFRGMKNCYSLATVDSFGYSNNNNFYGALTGQLWSWSDALVENSYCVGRIYGQQPPKFSNTFATETKAAQSGLTILTAENMQGELAAQEMSALYKDYVVTETYPILRSFSTRQNGEWSGFRHSAMDGAGTEASPWLISTPEQFAYVSAGGSAANNYYKLINDIYFNDITKFDYKTGELFDGYQAVPWLTGDATFNGIFDGNGHVVYGLWYPAGNEIGEANKGKGLFARLGAGSAIKNLGMSHCYIDARGYVGALVGYITNGGAAKLIDSCYSDETVTVIGRAVTSSDTGIAASGLVGGINGCKNLTISNCFSLASVSGDVTVRKILANIWNGSGKTDADIEAMNNKIISCYSDGELTYGNGNSNRVALVENCYSSAVHNKNTTLAPWTEIPAIEMTGAKALDRMPGLADGFAAVVKDYPVPKIFTKDAEAPDKSFWDGAYVKPTKGTGTEADPFLITNEEEFAYIVYNGGTADTCYKLTADLYLNRLDKIDWSTGELLDENYSANEWFTSYTTGGNSYYNGINEITFSGIVDGDGHTVYGMYYAPGQPGSNSGLFPAVKKATIKNLALKNSFAASGRWTAALVGCINKSGDVLTVDNVIIDDTVKLLAYNSGNYYYDGSLKSDRINAASPFAGVAANGVGFESCASGGIIGFVATSSTCNITNSAVYAKFDGTSCTAAYANPYSNGGNPIMVGKCSTTFGLMGTCWNPTALNFDNCIVTTAPVANSDGIYGKPNFTMSNVYNASGANCTRDGVINLAAADIQGANALDLTELDASVWYAVKAEGAYPSLRVIGTRMGDVDENGAFTLESDSAALREIIIEGKTSANNGDANNDGKVNVCDLVRLKLK